MTDRELLEMAAKAAGMPVMWHSLGMVHLNDDGLDAGLWRPLEDDGDALRLAVKLKIDIKLYDYYVICWFDGGYIGTGKFAYGDDPYSATRRAIVRAAAEIGKEMK